MDSRRRKKSVIVLQLAPMIDIFVLVIVFLLKGTVMSETVITSPSLVEMAKSKSKESTEIAPEVYITKTQVEFRMINEKVPLSEFNKVQFEPESDLIKKFKKYLEQTSRQEQSDNAVHHVNIVADYSIPYMTIYNVVREMRAAGFKAMLFIAAEGSSRE